MIKNRLEKNLKKLRPWAIRNNYQAFRIYDRDIPEFPFLIDQYDQTLLVYDRTEEIDLKTDKLQVTLQALNELFPNSKVIVKKRDIQTRQDKYQKLNDNELYFSIREGNLQFLVNLEDYLDTGLFLDHRPIRQEIAQKKWNEKYFSSGKFLNLFSYTCSFSVAAAHSGFRTYSVDLSKNYLDWGKRNFDLNQILNADHFFINEDSMSFLKTTTFRNFDIIFCDPPTFSNSKKTESYFEVEEHQEELINDCMKLLSENGVLIFSTNKRRFKLSEKVTNTYLVKDVTERSIPMDFHDQKIHKCYTITKQHRL